MWWNPSNLHLGPSLSAQEDNCTHSYPHIIISWEEHKPFDDKIVVDHLHRVCGSKLELLKKLFLVLYIIFFMLSNVLIASNFFFLNCCCQLQSNYTSYKITIGMLLITNNIDNRFCNVLLNTRYNTTGVYWLFLCRDYFSRHWKYIIKINILPQY